MVIHLLSSLDGISATGLILDKILVGNRCSYTPGLEKTDDAAGGELQRSRKREIATGPAYRHNKMSHMALFLTRRQLIHDLKPNSRHTLISKAFSSR